MLELAILNSNGLQYEYQKYINLHKNTMFFQINSYLNYDLNVELSEWNCLQYISKIDDKIIGYFNATINRDSYFVENLGWINFEESKKIVFAKDFINFLDLIFLERKFRKIVFYAIHGFPANQLYLKFYKKGFINLIGTYTEHFKCWDNKYHDVYLYEIKLIDYLKYRNK